MTADAGPRRSPTRNAVCVCADRNMLVPALFVLEAVRTRRGANAEHDLLLVTTGPGDVTDVHRRWLSERGMRLREDLDLSIVQSIEIRQARLTNATLLKLLLADAFADRYDKILYLDADLTIHEELTPIFSLDTQGRPLAAVPSGAGRTGLNRHRQRAQEARFRALGMTEPYRPMNTGVMLIDVGSWRRYDLTARALDFLRRNPKICPLPDEDALNAILDGDVAELSPVWNMQAPIWSHPEVRALVQPAVLHYVGPNKPWRRFKDGKRLLEHRAAHRLYREFVAQSPWPAWLDEQWDVRDLRDSLVFELRHVTRKLDVRELWRRRRDRQAFLDVYRRHCSESAFADVEQGIVRREGTRLRLDASAGARSPA